MNYSTIRQLSFSLSVLLHLLLLVLFLLLKFTIDYSAREYVELSFGNSDGTGSAGGGGLNYEQPGPQTKLVEKTESAVEEMEEVKEVELPKAKNTEDESIVKPADKSKEKSTVNQKEAKGTEDATAETGGFGNNATGEGGFGFDIDFGGKGTRKIHNYALPAYPEGVEKEIDIRLRFTIRPDGTVGTIFPLQKADTRLENAAINSLRQWRFEPLSPNQRQSEQTAVIVFPYRLQ